MCARVAQYAVSETPPPPPPFRKWCPGNDACLAWLCNKANQSLNLQTPFCALNLQKVAQRTLIPCFCPPCNSAFLRLRQYLAHDIAMHVRQTEIAPLRTI